MFLSEFKDYSGSAFVYRRNARKGNVNSCCPLKEYLVGGLCVAPVRFFAFGGLVFGAELVTKRFKGAKTKGIIARIHLRPFRVQSALFVGSVFIIVAVETQESPIAAVGRIVHVIAVFVVYRQLAQSNAGELPAAALADVREHFERLFAVGFGLGIIVTF